MEIVFLETISLGDDINLDRFDELGHVTKYSCLLYTSDAADE